MTTNHPDPTPPTSPAAVSAPLRPVEELQALCDAASPLPWVKHDDARMHIAHRWPNNVAVIATMQDIEAGPTGVRSSANRDLLVAAVNELPSLLARLRAGEETLAEMAPLLIARSDSASLIEGLEKVRRRLCHYGPDASTCDCKYGASFKGEQSGCPELRRAIAALAEGASR